MLGRSFLAALRGYRKYLSPLLGPHCRFHPTCSAYMEEAVMVYGPFRGAWMGLRRLLKCHPWHPGGVDPVPETGKIRTEERGAWKKD